GEEGWLSSAVRVAARTEESALVGLAGARIAGTEQQNLRYSSNRFRTHRHGNDRTSGRQGQAQCHGPRTFPGRTNENGADRLVAAPAQGAFPGRTYHRT